MQAPENEPNGSNMTPFTIVAQVYQMYIVNHAFATPMTYPAPKSMLRSMHVL